MADGMQLEPNDVIIDRATCLGRGNFGAVYAGTYRGRLVAIKMFTASEDVTPAEAAARFQSELAPLKASVVYKCAF